LVNKEKFKLKIRQDGQLVELQLTYNNPHFGWQQLFHFSIPKEDYPDMKSHMIEKLNEFELI